MAGCFAEPDVSGNHGGKYLPGEMPPDLLGHLHTEIGSAIVHGQHQTKNPNLGLIGSFYSPQGGHQIAESLQSVILALYRD